MLLGIVNLGQVLKFILQGISGTPQFKEVTQYNSALLADVSSVDAAVARVRDELLIPLRDALITLAKQFYTATDPNKGFEEDPALDRLERLYPDVGRAYREMRAALQTAIDASTTVRDADALLSDFAAIYGAGRRFIAAIDRVANDPLAAVHEALREAFTGVIADAIDQAQSLVSVTELVDGLATFKDNVFSNLSDLFGSVPEFLAWRRLVFALPGGHSAPAQVDAIDAAVGDAFAAAAATFLQTLVTDGLDLAVARLGRDFDAAFQQQINAAATQPVKDALIAAQTDWWSLSADPGERIKGVVFDDYPPPDPNNPQPGDSLKLTTLGSIRKLAAAATTIAGAATSIPPKITAAGLSDALKSLGDALFASIAPGLAYGLTQALDLCGKVAGALVTLAGEFVPNPSSLPDIEGIQSTVKQAYSDAADKLQPLGLRAETLAIGKLVDDDLNAILSVRNALLNAAKQVASLGVDVCTTPTALPLDALGSLRRVREALLIAVNRFQLSVATLDAVNVGGLLNTLMGKIVGSSSQANDARAALAKAAATTLSVSERLCEVTRYVTSLRAITAPGQTPLAATRTALLAFKALPYVDDTFKTQIDAIVAAIDAAAPTAQSLQKSIDKNIKDLTDKAGQAIAAGQEQQYLSEALALAATVPPTINDVQLKLVAQVERAVLANVSAFVLAGDPYIKKMIVALLGWLAPIFSGLANTQTKLVKARDAAWNALPGSGTTTSGSGLGDDLSNITLDRVKSLLLVNPTPGGTPPDDDLLASERDQLEVFASLGSTDPTKLNLATFQALGKLLLDWSKGQSSAQLLAEQLGKAATAVLSGDLKRIVDLEGARRRIEEKIKELIPAKVVASYDLQCELQDVGGIFIHEPGSQITLSASATYNLLEWSQPPHLIATCKVDPFDIDLFEVVTLIFSGAQFVNESGKGSDFHISYKDFELGPAAEFLKPLETLMNPGGSGPYVRPSADFPGIEAGFTLDLGIISVGVLAFINVSISASCILPFDNRAATFTASIGREDRPVLLSCLPYIGGGFLTLYADAHHMIGFAASFEFGGGGGFQFGPLSGQGRISTGIYLRLLSSDTGQTSLIEGFFYAGGEAHIACFAISATLVVRVAHQTPGGTMQGSAVFTFSFSIGFAKLRYSVGVQRKVGKGFSGQSSVMALRTLRLVPSDSSTTPTVVSLAAAQQENWSRYLTYFAADVNGFPI